MLNLFIHEFKVESMLLSSSNMVVSPEESDIIDMELDFIIVSIRCVFI